MQSKGCFMNLVYRIFLSTLIAWHFTHLVVGWLYVITSGQWSVSRSYMCYFHAKAFDCQRVLAQPPRKSEKVAALGAWGPGQRRYAEASAKMS